MKKADKSFQKKNKIIVSEIFKSAGYDISVDEANQYILNSRDKYKNGDIIWLDIGANLNNVSADDKASNAMTYIKSNGENSGQFSYANRKARN